MTDSDPNNLHQILEKMSYYLKIKDEKIKDL